MINRPDFRRSRGTLFWGVTFFLAAVALSEACLAPQRDALRDPLYILRRDRVKQRLNAMTAQAGGVSPRLIITLGSSRIHNGIDGQTLERELSARWGRPVCVGNFAVNGTGPVHGLVLLGRLLRDGLKPDAVLVEALPGLIESRLNDDAAYYNGLIPYTPEDQAWLAEHDIQVNVPRVERDGLLLITYRSAILRRIMSDLLPRGQVTEAVNLAYRSDVWGSRLVRDSIGELRRQRGVDCARKGFFPTYQTAKWGGPGMAALSPLLAELRSREISAAVVVTPEGPVMRSWYRPGAVAELTAELTALTQAHQAGLVSAGDWFEEADFADSHHMLAPTAARFSQRLGREAFIPLFEREITVAAAPQHSRR